MSEAFPMFAYHTPVIIFLGRERSVSRSEDVPVAAGESRERCGNELCIESESLSRQEGRIGLSQLHPGSFHEKSSRDDLLCA